MIKGDFMNRIKELRNAKGINQQELAKILNVQRPAISKYENGEISLTDDTMRTLADYFGVTTDYLLGCTDDVTPPGEKKGSLDEQLSGIEFALFGEIRELDDEDKEDLLRDVRKARELRELRKLKKALDSAQGDANDEVRKKEDGN